MSFALIAEILGGTGRMQFRTSAEPEKDVWERLPCLPTSSRAEAMIEEVVETLKVEWESPPVPTMSH
jgi:hypothetical protein